MGNLLIALGVLQAKEAKRMDSGKTAQTITVRSMPWMAGFWKLIGWKCRRMGVAGTPLIRFIMSISIYIK